MTKLRKKIIDVFGTTDAPGESISPRGTMPDIEKALEGKEFISEVREGFRFAAKDERNRMCLVINPNNPDVKDMHMTMGDRSSVGIMRNAIKDELDGCIAMTSRTRDPKHERSLCCGTFQVSDFQNMIQFGLNEMILVSNQTLVDEGYYRFNRGDATDEEMQAFVDYLMDHREEINHMLMDAAEVFSRQDHQERAKQNLSQQDKGYYESKEIQNQSETRQWNAFHNYIAALSEKFGFVYEHVPASPEALDREIEAYKQRSNQHVDSEASVRIRKENKALRKQKSIYGDARLDKANAAQLITVLSSPKVTVDILQAAFKKDLRDDVRAAALRNPKFPKEDFKKYAIDGWHSLSPSEKEVVLGDFRAGQLKMGDIVDALDDPKHGLDYAQFLTDCDRKRGIDSLVLKKAAEVGRKFGDAGCTKQAILNRDLNDEDRAELMKTFKLMVSDENYKKMERELEEKKKHWEKMS